MNQHKFRDLFQRALKSAAKVADERVGKRVPRSFLIELHDPTSLGEIMSVDEAVDRLYLGENKFYQIIDIAIQKISFDHTIAFVRVSGHPPGPFSQTWEPTRFGPFKQILAQSIEDTRVS
jgi:hypothetical protein